MPAVEMDVFGFPTPDVMYHRGVFKIVELKIVKADLMNSLLPTAVLVQRCSTRM